jgi:hypothetical protein
VRSGTQGPDVNKPLRAVPPPYDVVSVVDDPRLYSTFFRARGLPDPDTFADPGAGLHGLDIEIISARAPKLRPRLFSTLFINYISGFGPT